MDENIIINSYINNNDDVSGKQNLTKFFGYNQNIYLDPAVNGYSFIFITKPSLFLYPSKPAIADVEKELAYENMCIDPYFSMFITNENDNEKDNTILKQLSYFTFSDSNTLFMPIFTNLTKSFPTTDINLDNVELYMTKEGYKYLMPTNTTQSEGAGSLSLGVNETLNMDFTKILTLWVNYIKYVTNGTFNANPTMIKQNMLDYTCSIYYFVVAPDGQTLKYWCKYTSCYPTTIPYSNLGYQKGTIDNPQYDIQFTYAFKEDMNPCILEEFNMVSLQLVTPSLCVGNSYDDFLTMVERDDTNGYTSYTQSPLLNKKLLLSGKYSEVVSSADRDPLILFKEGIVSNYINGKTTSGYILSFGENSLKFDYANSTIEDNSAYNYNELIEKL